MWFGNIYLPTLQQHRKKTVKISWGNLPNQHKHKATSERQRPQRITIVISTDRTELMF